MRGATLSLAGAGGFVAGLAEGPAAHPGGVTVGEVEGVDKFPVGPIPTVGAPVNLGEARGGYLPVSGFPCSRSPEVMRSRVSSA